MVMITAGRLLEGGRRAIEVVGATTQQLQAVVALDKADGRVGMLIDPSIDERPTGTAVMTGVREGTTVFDIISRVRALYCEYVLHEVMSASREGAEMTSDDEQWLRSVVRYVLLPTTPPLPSQVLDDRLVAALTNVTDYLYTLSSSLGRFSLDRLEALKRGLPS